MKKLMVGHTLKNKIEIRIKKIKSIYTNYLPNFSTSIYLSSLSSQILLDYSCGYGCMFYHSSWILFKKTWKSIQKYDQNSELGLWL